MASPVVELKGHVHIAPCGRDRCQRKIKELSEALKKKELICITENDYGLGGSFAKWFCQGFEGCQFTVIHKCRRLWEKICSFEDTLLTEHGKIIAVILNDEMKIKQDEREAGKRSSFYKFFNHSFHTHNAVDEKSFKTFVERLQSECGVSGLDTASARDGRSHTQDISTPTSVSDNTELKQYSPSETDGARETVEMQSFVEYQNMLMYPGPRSLYINKSCLQFTQDQVLNKFSDTVPSSCIEALSHMNNLVSSSKEEQLRILIQILYQVLPKCYQEHNIVGVTCIACCDSLVLQLEATKFLVLMLLSREDEERQLSITTLCLMESLIYWMILRTCERCKNSEDSSIVTALQNLSTLYMMIVSEMVLTCRGNEERLCNMQLGTIAARPLPDNAKYPDVIKTELRKFIQDITSKDSSHWKNTGERFLTDDPSAQGKALAKKRLVTQVITAYQVLKKLFKSRDVQHLVFLYDFINAKADEAVTGDNRNPNSCIMILVQGMTLFLTVGLKKAVDQDLGTVCEKCLEAIQLFPEWTLTKEMRDSMETLYFVHNPRIREGMIEYSVGQSEDEDEDRDFVYRQDQLKILVSRMEKLLIPFLSVLRSSIGEYKGSWSLGSGKFDQEDVLLQLYRPTEEDHKRFNKAKFTNQEDIYLNEMAVLQKLQHKNIIKLLAYQATIIPQFYIVENYKIRNLQTALKNKRENQQTFDQITLLQYLLDAASAVEYCHREGYAHCNLNCASLFIARDESVKLSCFHLCLKLVDGKMRADAHLNQLSVRWTAPESIEKCEFSSASDVWMFGHLIFETLSHGLLPYEQFDDPLVLSKKIIKELVPFAHEDYISKEHLGLIYDCKKMNSSQRITIEQVRTQLQGFYADAQKPLEREEDYPADAGEFKPSTGHEKGIPDVYTLGGEDDKEGDEEQSAIAFPLSDTLMLLKNGKNNCVHEKIVFKLPPEMINRVKGGELKDIFPKVRVEQLRKEAPHIVCEIPSSCQGSLYDVAARRSLGDELSEYMKCFYQTAVLMDQLHKRSWVLGDISAAYLYVEHRNNNIQVYVVSLAYLRPLEINFRDIPSEDPLVRLRAAPEVVRGGVLSPATDVYCFGNLMWEVLQAFDDGIVEYMGRFGDMKDSTPENEYMEKISESWETSHAKPICCPDELYDLMKSCVHSRYKERIKTEQLVEKLNRFTAEETAVKTV